MAGEGTQGPGRPGATEETLRRLEQRLARASEAAERLMAQAAGDPGETAEPAPDPDPAQQPREKPPPAGWQFSSEQDRADLELVAALLQSVRELVPAELQHRLAEALREALLALRALIDWYLERLEGRRAEPVEVEDIPIL